MKKNKYEVIGVMSGTSLDGIDLAHCSFEKIASGWAFEIHDATTIDYTHEWEERLKDGVHLSGKALESLNQDYTELLSNTIHEFITSSNLTTIDLICSHGHTIHHQPEKEYTLQIGNLPQLKSLLPCTVICDFRVQDVKLGGQGAPLVPIGDQLLFSEYDYCLNLGGFANISTVKNNKRIAYDVCPVNIVLNHYVKGLGVPYDDKGQIAASGNVNEQLLSELNSLSFYKESPPKSLGFEWVLKQVIPLIDSYDLNIKDTLCTVVEHVAMQLTKVFEKGSVLITGGGVYNDYLISRLQAKSGVNIIVPNSKLIAYKEALIFGLLGVLKSRGEMNVLSAVTGAKEDHSSGVIYT